MTPLICTNHIKYPVVQFERAPDEGLLDDLTWQIGDRQLQSRPEWDDDLKSRLIDAGFSTDGMF